MTITPFIVGVLLVIPMQSWSGSDEELAPIPVDPRATLLIRYPGEDRLMIVEQGPSVRPPIAVVEGQRVPITRLPDGSCPRVTTVLLTYPEQPPMWFEDDGRYLWYPGTSSQESERLDVEACEVVMDQVRSQIRWKRVEIRLPDAHMRQQLKRMGLKIPIDPLPEVR